jgi:hypothetical protein
VNYFFDSSALIKLHHPERGSEPVMAMFGEADRQIIISRLAGVELRSALALKTRMGHLDRENPLPCVLDFSMTWQAAQSRSSLFANSTTPRRSVLSSDTATC